MKNKTVLITGGLGFIGAHFVHYVFHHFQEVKIIVLDKNTYAADVKRMEVFMENDRFVYEEGDIVDGHLIDRVFTQHQPTYVINFAAETHVDNSIEGPKAFLKTNEEGTFNLLEAARKLWLQTPQKLKETFKAARFYQISTDEVFGSLGESGHFTEASNYAPNSPYSASKAAADHWVRSYSKTFGLPTLISHCSNNFGPHQHDEKLIPTIIRTALRGEPIPIYGDGKNIRDWLFVEDHCHAIATILQHAKPGDHFNIGAKNERTNLEICQTIVALLDQKKPKSDGSSYGEQIAFVKDRLGHDFRYAIDPTKIKKELNWEPRSSFSTAMALTVDHYVEKYAHLIPKES